MELASKTKKFFSALTFLYFFLALVFSFFALRHINIPYFWISVVWWPFFLHLSYKTKRDFIKVIYFNIFLLILLIGFIELLFSDFLSSNVKSQQISKKAEFTSSSNKDFMYRHDVLGYAPTPNNIVKHKEKYSNGESLEVIYTINKDGLRVAMPNYKEDEDYKESVIFFGGSCTFGEAVKDNETLPFLFGKYTNWKYKVYNFGFEGYGPHQMLAALEKGIISKIVSHNPKSIIYNGIRDHINRVIRSNPWIKYGPKYIMKNGKPVYVGQFDDISDTTIVRQLFKSFIVKRLIIGINKKIKPNKALQLFISIVEESRNHAKKLYPNSEFIVILWGPRSQYYKEYNTDYVVNELRKRGIIVHEMKEIIPNFTSMREKYVVKNNGHPNRLAYEIIAKYIATRVLE